MKGKFVIQEAHFHIAEPNCYVMIGWFDGEDQGSNGFEVQLDRRSLPIRVSVLTDESVRQKYAKYDLQVTKEYIICVQLPQELRNYKKLILFSSGDRAYERSVRQLCKLQGQLNYRITNIQMTGADCILTGWVASEKQIKLTVYNQNHEPVQCEISHFPRTDVNLEYRESDRLVEGGFSVTVPVTKYKKLVLQITDGLTTVNYKFKAQDKGRLMYRLRKAHYYYKRNGFVKTFKRAVNELYELVGDTGNYQKWRKKNNPTEKELEAQRKRQPEDGPVFYGLVSKLQPAYLGEFLASLGNQTYQNWRLLLAVTGEEQEEFERLRGELPDRLHEVTKRIECCIVNRQDSQSRMAALLQGFVERTGKTEYAWCTFLDVRDTLEAHALYTCEERIRQEPSMDMLYTDEDKMASDGSTFMEPVLKSDFNIDMLRAMNYLGHMVLLRSTLVARVGEWTFAYDYFLRAAEQAVGIGHLPRILYHERKREEEEQDPDGQAMEALRGHYQRSGIPASVEPSGTPGIYHTIYHWEEKPLVSINIPNKDHVDDLDTCVQSVLKYCTYPNYEIVIIENNSTEERTFDYYEKLQKQEERIRVVYWKDIFNFSRITNFGVENSKGDYILLLNNDTEVITPGFMEELLGYCMRKDVGICGARLFYFDDTIQHAGVIIGLGGICGEGFQGFPKENGGYQNRILCPQDYSAVTAACMMTKRSVFEAVGGMDGELQVAYNDIDYCLKVRELGKLVVYNPFATMHHYEYKSRGTENTAAKLARYQKEVDLFTTRWADIISKGDPYYNPNLTKRYQDFSLRRIELL